MKTCVIDIETSGLPPKGADYKIDFMKYPRILSIAFKINNEETIERIINQGSFHLPSEAMAINGITQEMCNDSIYQLEGVLIEEILSHKYFDFIVGHNIYFDTSIIKANILRLIAEEKITEHVFDKATEFFHKDKRIDTMRACASLWKGKWPTLTESYERLFQEKFEAHSAGSDVDATYRIFQELIRLNAIKLILPEKVVEEVIKTVKEEI